ncbi:hypothetical protein RR48_08633 [Papilio machaon]|uniref:Uncharacterized protein n=1 Tax=Papilio machaon TaxID=76193 RepID=A0A194R8I9_PAPMA|nr:hypothetical protein RR48_08633 [Papilio machaon]
MAAVANRIEDYNLQSAASISECGRAADGGWRAARAAEPPSSERQRRPLPRPRGHMSLMNMRRYDYENMLRPEYGIWRRGSGRARANGRSLIYEPGAAPPPCHNRGPVRARPPPAARRSPLALSPASDGEWCGRRSTLATRDSARTSRARPYGTTPRVSALPTTELPCAGGEPTAPPPCRASSPPPCAASPSVLTTPSSRTTSHTTPHSTPTLP